MKTNIFFAFLKSMKKGVGSGVGSGSISQRYGSGFRIHTKMSWIPNTGSYPERRCRRSRGRACPAPWPRTSSPPSPTHMQMFLTRVIYSIEKMQSVSKMYEKLNTYQGISYGVKQRVGRVLSFFSSRQNWDPPTPNPQASVPPTLCFSGRGHTRLRGRGWGSPNSNEGYSVFVYM